MNPHPQAIVAGHICLDVIPDLSQLPDDQFAAQFQPGHLVSVGAATFSAGGSVSNTGLALHRLGIPTRLIAKVGADPFGQVICDLVARIDPALASGIVRDEAASTSYTVIISPPGVDRIFLHSPGANHTFCAADVADAPLEEADLFHLGYPPLMRRMVEANGQQLVELFRRVRAAGATTSLDMAFPDPLSKEDRVDWRAILAATLPHVDIFAPSIEELLFMIWRDTYDLLRAQSPRGDVLEGIAPPLLTEVSDDLLAMGAKVILLKLGYQGAYLRTAGESALRGMGRAAPADPAGWADVEWVSPCFEVEVVGTTGSGDATIAGFLSALLRGLSAREALTMAVAVGACNVEAADAISGLRSWEATQTRVAQGWASRPLDLSSYGWHKVDDSAIWTRG